MKNLWMLVVVCVGASSACNTAPTSPTASPQRSPILAPVSQMNVSGTVIDESGTPIVGATVSLSPSGGSASTAVTDTNGRYAVTLPATADFEGRADKAGYDTTCRRCFSIRIRSVRSERFLFI